MSGSRASHALGLALALFLVQACGGGSGGRASPGLPGQLLDKPEGGVFFVDPNQGGGATRLHLAECLWGRLVDVHDVDARGETRATPVLRDFVIAESVQTSGADYLLETNPVTQRTRLVVRRSFEAPDAGAGTFLDLVRRAAQDLAPVLPRADDAGATASYVARNSGLVLRFDDVLADGDEERLALSETVRVLSGSPRTPLTARIFFDAHHGALLGGAFHSTRVIVDFAVSEAESAASPAAVPVNATGLPPSPVGSAQASASLRLPTREAPGVGQFVVLRALSGAALDTHDNGPLDGGSETLDVVRAIRAGNEEDVNAGFLLDLDPPRILGDWPVRVLHAESDPQGTPGSSFLLELEFTSLCRSAPRRGDVLALGERVLDVVADGSAPDTLGRVSAVRVQAFEVVPPAALSGAGTFSSALDRETSVAPPCWLAFLPAAGEFPARGVPTDAEIAVRFSEPMAARSLAPFDSFQVVRADSSSPVTATNLVVGDVNGSAGLSRFTFRPRLPLAHSPGNEDLYHARLLGPTDLAGNRLVAALQPVDFSLDAAAAGERNGGLVLRFDSVDEVEPFGLNDLRGPFFFDLARGALRPRPVSAGSHPADRTNPVPGLMTAFLPGVQTPFSPLGSKLQTLWRYCDFGWQVLDESKYDLDVVGLAWAPVGGRVQNDFFERFEIRLGHALRLPDEALEPLLAFMLFPGSGLKNVFADNLLQDPRSPQRVVHARDLGYRIRFNDLFVASSGTAMVPLPLEATGTSAFTWRDTSVRAKGGPEGGGVPLAIEVNPPLEVENVQSSVALVDRVPSIGLPLLIEFRCYPSSVAIGLNAADISIATNSTPDPSFRVFSTGGIDQGGQRIARDPDLEDVARGGFNPRSTPPGMETPRAGDNAFYIGQLDTVTRITRMHTVWMATEPGADYSPPVVLPPESSLPQGVRIVVEARGADGFAPDFRAPDAPFDARAVDAYGELFVLENGRRIPLDNVAWHAGDSDWHADLDELDGAAFVQLRVTWIGNVQTGEVAELAALGVPYAVR